MQKNRKLVEGALLIAISVILTRYMSIKISVLGVDGVRIGLGVMPIIIAGLRNGAFEGAKVGALADIIGYALSPGGAYMPHFTLTSALNGILPPLLIGKKENINSGRIIFSVGLTFLITSMILVPYFLNILFGIPYKVIFLPRLISFILNVFLMNTTLIVLEKRVNILSFDKALAH
ncbi:MAG: folate family ECF transporter S component [Bacillota bacterium]|uniref:Folate family ECF transporter S component n=1 Tax=Thermanaerosceptrum fracticalcis TaxID=1712410 RepID=A0A7G6E703_THEFR|nr:folate family ECF transporter S component [Thermanaerosceptrum fracticalcis]QNB47857.1 folate family ECF transporter S component [Thermanaerosceptrum fracticalcis]